MTDPLAGGLAQGRSPRLGPGAEFDLIRRFLADAPPLPEQVLVGPGDDAAVFRGGWVVSTDLSMEDVHFRRAWLSDREIGYRAATAALSDLAAMAAEPAGALVSMAFPSRGVDAEAVTAGVRDACAATGTALVGGDVSGSPGPLVVDVIVLGRAERPALRSDARPGDEVWVSGRLGASAGAVRAWEAGEQPDDALRAAYARPTARIGLARALAARAPLGACIDVSDGLAGDAGHLAAASGVRIVLDEGALPVAAALTGRFGPQEALELALHGGEDYELCFTTRPVAWEADALAAELGVPLSRVGRVEAGEGVWLLGRDGRTRPLERGGFSHVREGGGS